MDYSSENAIEQIDKRHKQDYYYSATDIVYILLIACVVWYPIVTDKLFYNIIHKESPPIETNYLPDYVYWDIDNY